MKKIILLILITVVLTVKIKSKNPHLINWYFIKFTIFGQNKIKMKFRSDISFLRAFSVLAVLLYHFKFNFIKGGFIGVDIFFVISGYLMTKIILSAFTKNNFSLLDFYKKRVVRIFPALLFMVSIFGVIIYTVLPTQFVPYLRSSFSSSLFFSNIYYYLNSGYFDASSQFNFLLHTWSLSVEWQFYMIYPLILLYLKKVFSVDKNLFNKFFIVITAISIISMLICNIYDKPMSFFMFFSRAWEMMFGGLAFLYEDNFKKVKNEFKKYVVFLSIFCLIICVYTIKSYQVIWPSLLSLIPVVSTTLILLSNIDLRLFRNKIITFLGNISYSLYLWHWPIYVISSYYGFSERVRYKIIFIGLSFIFAIFSYYFIEKRDYTRRVKYILAATAIVFICSITMSKINPQFYFSQDLGKLVDVTGNYKYSDTAVKQYSLGTKHLLHNQDFNNYDKSYLTPAINKKNIILLGDSHAGMFAQTISDIAKEANCNLIQFTADATFPEPKTKSTYSGPRELMNYFFSTYFPKNHAYIDTVIITANYKDYENLENKIKNVENYFKKFNTKVIFLGQTMSYDIDFPTSEYLKLHNKSSEKAYSTNQYLKLTLKNNYIDILSLPINKINNGMPYIYDSNHYTYYGTSQYKEIISQNLFRKE